MDTDFCVAALEEALAKYGIPDIFNTDQGSQFTSEAYRELLRSQGIRQSMDGKARWVDNVMIERWFRSLKTEYVYINEYGSPKELRAGIRAYAADYNSLRPHQSHGYATPEQIYRGVFTSAA